MSPSEKTKRNPLLKNTVLKILTLLIAAIGAYGFFLQNWPLPFLLGPLAACLIAAFIGIPMKGIKSLSIASRTMIGVAVGATLTPEFFGNLSDIKYSIALVPFFILAIALVGFPFFRYIRKYDPVTSFYSSMPASLQDIIAFGELAGANVRSLSLIHATRILFIVTTTPFIIYMVWGVDLTNAPGQPAETIPALELIMMIIAGLIGWWYASAIGLFGAAILGPLIVTAAFSMAGFISHRPPTEAIMCAQYFIGISVGVKYVGITWREFRDDVVAGILFCCILTAISLSFALIVTHYAIAQPIDAFLAFAPGGQSEITILAIIVGADVAFVITHHLVRMILVITGAPMMTMIADKLMKIKDKEKKVLTP